MGGFCGGMEWTDGCVCLNVGVCVVCVLSFCVGWRVALPAAKMYVFCLWVCFGGRVEWSGVEWTDGGVCLNMREGLCGGMEWTDGCGGGVC